jgi:hypothetical protein
VQKNLGQLPVYFALVILLAGVLLTGCSSAQPAASSGTQSTPAATAPASQTQPASQAQPASQTTSTSGQQGGKQGGQDMQAQQTKLLARVAEILGVSTDSLTTAYNAALKSVMGDKSSSTTAPGQPPQPPTDGKAGGSGGTPPSGGQGKAPDMSGLYSKVADALGLTVDKVTAAFEQAQKELMPTKTQ